VLYFFQVNESLCTNSDLSCKQ